jgi:hypothetical protein
MQKLIENLIGLAFSVQPRPIPNGSLLVATVQK